MDANLSPAAYDGCACKPGNAWQSRPESLLDLRLHQLPQLLLVFKRDNKTQLQGIMAVETRDHQDTQFDDLPAVCNRRFIMDTVTIQYILVWTLKKADL